MLEIPDGLAFEYDGQYYVYSGYKPYVRVRDGESSFVLFWRTSCPDCGIEFEITTGRVINHKPRRRRCDSCKKRGVRVKKTESDFVEVTP